MLISVGTEEFGRMVDVALDATTNDDVIRNQLAILSSGFYYANRVGAENVFLSPEEIRLVIERIPMFGRSTTT